MTKWMVALLALALAIFLGACSGNGGDEEKKDTAAPVADAVDAAVEVVPTNDVPVADLPGDDVEGPGEDTVEPAGDVVDVKEEDVPVVDPFVPFGPCGNDDDLAVLAAQGEGALDATAAACGFTCNDEADSQACATTCVTDGTGLSAGCSGCFAQFAICSVWECFTECGGDATSADCVQCQLNRGCKGEFNSCAGWKCLMPMEYCTADDECCDDRSCKQVGGLVDPVCCSNELQSCTEDNDCCGEMYCVPGDGSPSVCKDCATTGFECEVDDDCCFGTCWNGSCQAPA
jgi:hypothetical protein